MHAPPAGGAGRSRPVARARPDSLPPPLRQVCLFLKRGADQHALDHEQQDPLSIAIQEANADIVTL